MEVSVRRSPRKKVKSIIVSNDDKDVHLMVDRSHEKQVLKDSKVLENCLKNGDISDSAEDIIDEPTSPFRNATVINDNYFMAQSVRSKTSKNSFSKVMQNFDLSEDKINEIVENQFVSERKQLLESYTNGRQFDEWFQLLKYLYLSF